MWKRSARIRELLDGRFIAEVNTIHPESGPGWIPIRSVGKMVDSIGTLDECKKYLSDMGFSECVIIKSKITEVNSETNKE